jgi:hypothetical protein
MFDRCRFHGAETANKQLVGNDQKKYERGGNAKNKQSRATPQTKKRETRHDWEE